MEDSRVHMTFRPNAAAKSHAMARLLPNRICQPRPLQEGATMTITSWGARASAPLNISTQAAQSSLQWQVVGYADFEAGRPI